MAKTYRSWWRLRIGEDRSRFFPPKKAFSSLSTGLKCLIGNFRAKNAIDFGQLGYEAFELIGGSNIGLGGNREMIIIPLVIWKLTRKLTENALGGYFALIRNVSGKFERLYDSVIFLRFRDTLVTIFALYPK